MGCVWGTINSLDHDNWHYFHSARPNLSKIWAHSHWCIRVLGSTHELIHSILRCSNTSYIQYVKVGWVRGTINSLNHDNYHHQCHFHSARSNLSKIWAHHHRCISVRQHSWAYPQHLKVLNHSYTCCVKVGWVWGTIHSINHDIGHHFHSARPYLSKIWAHCHRCISVRQNPWAYPQNLKVIKHFIYMLCESGMSPRYY